MKQRLSPLLLSGYKGVKSAAFVVSLLYELLSLYKLYELFFDKTGETNEQEFYFL